MWGRCAGEARRPVSWREGAHHGPTAGWINFTVAVDVITCVDHMCGLLVWIPSYLCGRKVASSDGRVEDTVWNGLDLVPSMLTWPTACQNVFAPLPHFSGITTIDTAGVGGIGVGGIVVG